MLALKPPRPSFTAESCTPNLLPCHIHHDGPVDASKRYWDPRRGEDGKLESYFRGRRLRGREVGVPRGYTGTVIREAVAEPRDQRRSSEPDAGSREGEGEEEEEVQDEMKSLESVASFEEMVIWGHEAVPEGDDAFVKGVEEWVGFAEAMHGYGGGEVGGGKREGVDGKG